MTDFDILRQRMLDNQIRPSDVTDRGILRAFGAVEREKFVLPADRPFAYADRELCVDLGEGARRVLPPPAIIAKMIQALDIVGGEVVLEIGCGSGYQSAILAALAGSVVATEDTAAMVALAEGNLGEIGVDNVAVVESPLQDGYPDEAPYDAILISGGTQQLPQTLFDQLNDGGRLVVVRRQGPTGQAYLYRRAGKETAGRPLFDAVLPVLPGFERAPEFVF